MIKVYFFHRFKTSVRLDNVPTPPPQKVTDFSARCKALIGHETIIIRICLIDFDIINDPLPLDAVNSSFVIMEKLQDSLLTATSIQMFLFKSKLIFFLGHSSHEQIFEIGWTNYCS